MLDNHDATENESTREERAHCARLHKRIKSFDKPLKSRAKGWRTARKYANGSPDDSDENGVVRVNMIGSKLASMQPSVYAKAPEIAVSVDDRIDTSQYPAYKKLAETLEIALNTFLVKEANLKARGKSAVRSSLVSTVGYVKIIYQIDMDSDPLIENRINDIQDNIKSIEVLKKETNYENGQCADYDAKIFELQHQIEGLKSKIEVVKSEGLVIDNIDPENLIVMDSSYRKIDSLHNAACITHKIKIPVSEYKITFGKAPPSGYKKYSSDDMESEMDYEESSEIDEDDRIVCVYEVWNLADTTVYTLCDGSNTYIRPPYHPEKLGANWYPFFGLQLRRVDGCKYPLSNVELMIELQDELNTKLTNAKQHREKNIPVRVFNKSSNITNTEIDAINRRTISTNIVGVTGPVGSALQDSFASLPEIPYNPQMYDTTETLRYMEMVAAVQDAAQGSINVAKTATEAEILSSGMQSRSSEAIDTVEDWLTDIANYAAQLLMQNVSVQTIKERFGEESVWPELDKESLFKMINISIRAGSTSKPNKIKEREQWIQLMPIIQTSIEKISAFKQQNQPDLVESTIRLMEETLRRFDENIDAKTLLGIDEDSEEGQEAKAPPNQPPPELLANIEQMKSELQRLTAENDELKAGHDVKMGEIDLKRRELELKNFDVKSQESAVIGAIQESQANMQAMENMLSQNQAIAGSIAVLAGDVPPPPKRARFTKLPDGSWFGESIED